MQVLYERCAAVDIGKDVIAVALRPSGPPAGRATHRRTFKTFYGVLREAARWLNSLGVTHVAMEATGIYSMPVYHALIEHGKFDQVQVCNAGHVKNVPGRKTDLADAERLVHLLECGLLRGSFIPPAEIKAARDVIRYRTKVVQSRTSEVQRLGNVLQDAGIKIDSVASSIATKSGRAVKWLLAIPHYIVLFFLEIGAFFAVIVTWFAILFTGRYPRGIFDFVEGVFRWHNRVAAYAFVLVTDRYPPFRLAP